MNKWFKLALNSFIGLILLNLLLGLFYGGGMGISLGSLLAFGFQLLYIFVVVGVIVGIGKLIKDTLLSKE